MITVVELTQTCSRCPSQWEGRLADGRWIYVRYRWGWLGIGVGESLDEAIATDRIEKQLGDEYDGELSMQELRAATQDDVIWPKENP